MIRLSENQNVITSFKVQASQGSRKKDANASRHQTTRSGHGRGRPRAEPDTRTVDVEVLCGVCVTLVYI